MLSKDFFRKHANEMVKKNLQQLVRPYPDEVTFQESLQRKADWDLYKHTLIEDITSLPVTSWRQPAALYVTECACGLHHREVTSCDTKTTEDEWRVSLYL